MECDDLQMAILMNWFKYKKHIKILSFCSKMSFNIGPLFLQIYVDCGVLGLVTCSSPTNSLEVV